MIPPNPINIASYLVEISRRQPTADALLTDLHRDAQGRLICTHTTFQQLNTRSDALAQGLGSLGITTGTRTALLLKPGIDFFAVTFALFKLGAIPVLIDPGIGFKNFGKCLAQAEPIAFLGIPFAHLLRRLLRWSKNTIKINITTGRFGGIPLQKLIALASEPSESLLHPSSDAAILFTSGSTGPPKGVLYTHANFDAQIQALKHAYNIQPGEIDLATFPLFGLFGPALGMTTVVPDMDFTRPGFVNPRYIIDPIQQFHITNMFGSPALIECVSHYGEAHNIQLPSLKRIISAGAPASAPTLARFSKMLSPEAQIFTPYGATEALPVSSIGSREILTETASLTDQGRGVCIGRPSPNIRIRIIKITDVPIETWSEDLEVSPGQIGEIVVEGPEVTTEYFNNPKATALAKIRVANDEPRTPGHRFFHRMGDCGYFDSAGRLWFVGRKSQRVRLPSGDLFSTPVEAIFNTHPSVARSALVGITRHEASLPVICIELKKQDPLSARGHPASHAHIAAELLNLAQMHEHTRAIKHVLFHPGFPVDIRHNAKINREQLAQWAQKHLQ